MHTRAPLAPGYDVSRVIVGGWQLSRGHHRDSVSEDEAVERLVAIADLGVDTLDCADIYTGVEELYGRFLKRWRTTSGGNRPIRIHTKLVPDLSALASVDRRYVEGIVDRSLRRLGVEALDLVQFYWWDTSVGRWTEAAAALGDLVRAGKIRNLGATNLTAAEVRALEEEAGVPVVADQVQYSVLDRRAEHGLAGHCVASGRTSILAFGGLAGGFLTSKWLDTAPPAEPFSNRSMTKYRLIIDEFGGWQAYQDLLHALAGMAASLGAGVLALAGGIEGLWGGSGGAPLRWGIAAAIVATFVISAALGIQRGIARLSLLNVWLFLAVLLFVVVADPAARLPGLGLSGAADYAASFVPRSLGIDVDPDWHRQWTIFNWANWFAWAPVTALFLGRLAIGYSVRAFILVNLLLPALFGAAWMIAVAGTTIILDQQSGGSLYAVLTSAGPDPLLYRLFSQLGGGLPVLVLLIGAIFISYVTAADSNVSAMSALSTHGISPESPEAPLAVKLAWGITVGLVATILVAAAGIDGIRMMSVLGGFPALFIILGAAVSLAVMAIERRPLVAATDR